MYCVITALAGEPGFILIKLHKSCTCSGVVAGPVAPHQNFELSENLFGIFTSKRAKYGAENSHFGEILGTVEIFSTHNLLCQKCATVCQKISTSCPTYFF